MWQTGTLTQNVMTFLKCSINGTKYGETTSDDMEKEVVVSTGEELDKTAKEGKVILIRR